MVPLQVQRKPLKTKEQPHEHHQPCERGEKRFRAGSDPTLDACSAPKSLRASEVAPGHCVFSPRSHVDKYLSEQTSKSSDPFKENTMPLLKPPEPQIVTRRLFVHIDEPLARTMERYAEFLGTNNLNHVVSQALQFIFKRDAQFKSWLTQNPKATPSPVRTKTEAKPEGVSGGTP